MARYGSICRSCCATTSGRRRHRVGAAAKLERVLCLSQQTREVYEAAYGLGE